MNYSFNITFTGPLFSYGAYQPQRDGASEAERGGTPEIRPPSIRGQLHWWHRALGGDFRSERAIFGGVSGKAEASKVVVRVASIAGTPTSLATLPHKSGGHAAVKRCFPAGAHFRLDVLSRLGGLLPEHQIQFERTLHAWLLLGTLGLRATRGGGSFQFDDASQRLASPTAVSDYEEAIENLLRGSRLRAAVLPENYGNDLLKARQDISDTIGGRDRPAEGDSLRSIRYPLGALKPERKTSPLRFRLYRFDDGIRTVALWDGRSNITGNTDADLAEVISLLIKAEKPIGRHLAQTSLATS